MAPHSDTLPHAATAPRLPRQTLAPDAMLNGISRRALPMAALLAGALLAWLLAEHTSPLYLLAWLSAYATVTALWLRDATSGVPVYVGRANSPGRRFLPSGLVAGLYGAICGAPVLLLDLPSDLLARASATMLNLCLVLIVAATNLKKAPGSPWFARVCLGLTFAGWALAPEAGKAPVLALVVAGWVFAEILTRRAAFLRRRFSEQAVRHGQAVDALRLKARELESTTSNRVRILGTVSHEIRQPVHALGMMVERLRIDPQSVEFRPQLDEVAAVVRSLAHSLALLLDISRLDAGTVKVKTSITSIQVLLERLTREFGFDARRKGLTLECTSDQDVRIDTDFALFYGVVANFVSNALRYTDRGYIKVFTSSKGPGELWVHVRDSGRGIPQDRVKDIFEEYVRLDRENQAAQGFGLGLAIVRRTAQLLGLQIEVTSEVGVGSEFKVSVACSSQSQPGGTGTAISGRQSTVSRSLVGLRVVLVDNDAAVLRGIDSIVRSWGCVPLACQSVDELAGKLQHMPGIEFDCIVADFHLGTGQPNGLAAIALVRRHVQRFVSATIFTGDLNIRPADLPLQDVHVAHKPVVPARICVMFEEMAAETQRRRPEVVQEVQALIDDDPLDDASMTDAMPLASSYSLAAPAEPTPADGADPSGKDATPSSAANPADPADPC